MSEPKGDKALSEAGPEAPEPRAPAPKQSAPRKPAKENPWYVLATLAGEQSGGEIDWNLHERNRRYWNAWASQNLRDAEKAKIKDAEGNPLLMDAPAWSEVEAEVQEAFAKRLPGVKLPSPADLVNFQDVAFSNLVFFEKFYFPAHADFNRAAFSGDANFNGAAFSKRANFNYVAFSGLAYFDNAAFSGLAYFYSAAFTERADFSRAAFTESADFNGAAFSGTSSFSWAAFSKQAKFDGATFSKRANFAGATFSKRANFAGATFSERANFLRTKFSGRANFYSATLSGPTKFIETVFSQRVEFTDASFDAPCNFRDAKFQTAYPDLEGTVLHGKTNVTAEEGFWPPARKQNPDPEQEAPPKTDKQAAQSCAHLRQNMAAQGLPDAAHFFFRREMTHRARIAQWWERPFYILYRAVEYGYGVWQPTIGIIATWALGWLALWIWGAMTGLVAAALSFSNVFRFFGFQRVYFEPGLIKNLPFWLEVMTGAQTVLGFVLLFLLGLGLRNRFRIK